MLLKPTERLNSQIMNKSFMSNSNGGIVDCVIRSDSPYRGSLYISGLRGIENINNIRQLNVKSILSCSQGGKLNYNIDDVPNYKYIPLPQNSIFSLNDYFRTVSQFIKESLQQSNCIVHCQNGRNKSIPIIIAYLMRYQNLSLNEALSSIKGKLKKIDLNIKYQQSLKQFQKHVQTSSQKCDKENNSRQINNSYHQSRRSQKTKEINESMDSKIDLNPEDTDIKINKFDTSKRYKTSKSYVNDEYLESDQKQSKSKIKTQNPSNLKNQFVFSNEKLPIHKEALHFDQVFSSNHIEYKGIKRQPKNSKSCFKKQKSNLVSFSPQSESFQIYQPEEGKIDYLTVSKELNKQKFSSRNHSQILENHKTQRSERNSQNKSILSRNGRQKTKKTQQMDNAFLKVLNPQHQQLSKSRVSQISRSTNGMKQKSSQKSLHTNNLKKSQSRFINDDLDISQIVGRVYNLSPSKREHFEKTNQELNTCIDHITTSYETEMTNLRVNYHNRLRHLRPNKNPTQQSQSAASQKV